MCRVESRNDGETHKNCGVEGAMRKFSRDQVGRQTMSTGEGVFNAISEGGLAKERTRKFIQGFDKSNSARLINILELVSTSVRSNLNVGSAMRMNNPANNSTRKNTRLRTKEEDES